MTDGVVIEGTGPSAAEAVARARELMQASGTAAWRAKLHIPSARPSAAPSSTAPVQVSAAPSLQTPILPAQAAPRAVGRPILYAFVCLLLTIAGITSVWTANGLYAPEMYDDAGMVPAAEAFAEGQNYAVFDLNLNIRRLRDEHIARMTETPEVIILGASHWQEAHAGLLPGYRFYNSHVHRDYWEDMLAMAEIWLRHDRLPKKMIIAVRDKMFTPMAARTDYLWEPGVPYWRAMADRLGIAKESWRESLPYQRMRERLSLAMLFNNVTRWHNANERPHPTTEEHFKSLDTLLPDGSILWSADHLKIFTPERAEREAVAFANGTVKRPPMVEERGVSAFGKLLDFLKSKGVEVTLVHPPFNPLFYDRVQGTPYFEGLKKIEELARQIAAEHGLKIVGSFNPHKVGCTADMYIDAEHSNPECLQKIFDEFAAIDKGAGAGQ